MRLLAAIAVAMILNSAAWAEDLRVRVHTPAGQPVADAVVIVRPQAQGPRKPLHFPWPYRMAQKGMQFTPFVLIVPVGAEVAFPNQDMVLHHVYSFSPAKTFQLRLYGHDETRLVRFERPGVVAVGCNIHDGMVGFIRVVDTPHVAKTNAAGEAIVADLPLGAAVATIWHPYLRGPGNQIAKSVVVARSTQNLEVQASVRPPAVRQGAY